MDNPPSHCFSLIPKNCEAQLFKDPFTCRSWLTSRTTFGSEMATDLFFILLVHVLSCSLFSSFSTLSRGSTWFGMMKIMLESL